MEGAVLTGGGSILRLLLLPGEVAAGWAATPRTVVTIREAKGKGFIRGPKESREEECEGC